jgi:hypothetical protein
VHGHYRTLQILPAAGYFLATPGAWRDAVRRAESRLGLSQFWLAAEKSVRSKLRSSSNRTENVAFISGVTPEFVLNPRFPRDEEKVV